MTSARGWSQALTGPVRWREVLLALHERGVTGSSRSVPARC